MRPEHSRINHYKEIKNLDKKKKYNVEIQDDINFNVNVSYHNPNFIDYDLINKLVRVMDMVSMTIGDTNINHYINSLTFHFIDNATIFVVLNVKEKHRGIFFGRSMNNIFAIKRLLSNISATASRRTGDSVAITMHHITD